MKDSDIGLACSAAIERRNRRIDVDPHRFGGRVFEHRLESHITAVAGVTYAAEGGTGIHALVAIDPNHPANHLTRHSMRALEITRPQTAAESVDGIVGDRRDFGV